MPARSSRWDQARPTTSTISRSAAARINASSAATKGVPEQFAFIIPDAWAYRTVNLQVERAFRFGDQHAISIIFQGFNIFGYDNFAGYQGFIPNCRL